MEPGLTRFYKYLIPDCLNLKFQDSSMYIFNSHPTVLLYDIWPMGSANRDLIAKR